MLIRSPSHIILINKYFRSPLLLEDLKEWLLPKKNEREIWEK